MSCLFLPVHSSYDRYSLSSKNYEPHAFYRKHFWCFPHLERRIYTYLVCFCQRTLATIDIPFRAGIMNRTRFIESISGGFSHLERRMVMSAFEPSGPSGRSLSRFPQHEATESISTPPWLGCQSITGLPPALSSPVPIFTPGWREAL